jgi:DNA-binding beta-propeller fold protein YncE
LAVLERDTPRLALLDTNRQIVVETAGSGLGEAQLRRPRCVRAGFGLTLLVADEQGRLLTYDSRLRFIDSFEPGVEATGFSGGSLSGLAVARSGDTYLSDRHNDVVYHFDPAGRFVETFGGPDAGLGRLSRPEGLSIAEDGKLVVCDTGAGRIVVFGPNGEYLTSFGEGDLSAPVAVAVTPDDGAVFLCDGKSPRLVMYTLEGRRLAAWDGFDLVSGGFGDLTDVVIDGLSLLVVDSGNRRVLRFRLVPAAE